MHGTLSVFRAATDKRRGAAYVFFRRVNSKTIRCIISEQDMLQSGIKLDDIFERKQKAIDFIKGIISKAVEAENFR